MTMSEKTRFEALDGWRGLAALAVCLYHVPVFMPMQGFARWQNLEMMVDLFLVLSGFVIAHSWGERLRDGASLRAFTTARFRRIMPMHVAMLLVLLVLELAKLAAAKVMTLPLEAAPFTETRSVATLVSNVFLTQALNLHGTTSWNLPAWSISVEFWTYLVFGAVMLFSRRHAVVAFVAIAVLGVAGLALFSPRSLLGTHDWGIFRALMDFFVGVLTYHLFRRGKLQVRDGAWVELATLALVGWFILTVRQGPGMLLAPLVFALLVAVFAQTRGPVHHALMSRPVQALGLWSYSLYMLHDVLNYIAMLGVQVASKLVGFPLEKCISGKLRVLSTDIAALDALAVAMLIGLSVALSRWTYAHIELPFMARRSTPKAPTPQIALA